MEENIEFRIAVKKEVIKSVLCLAGESETADNLKPHYDVSVEEMAKAADESPAKMNVLIGGVLASFAVKEYKLSQKTDNA